MIISFAIALAGFSLSIIEDDVQRGHVGNYLGSLAGIQAEKDRLAAERVAEEARQQQIAEAEAARLKAQNDAEKYRQENEAQQKFKAAEFDLRETKIRNAKKDEERAFDDAEAAGGWKAQLSVMVPRVERMIYEFARDGLDPTPLRTAAVALKVALEKTV
jgi:hypothetical protein